MSGLKDRAEALQREELIERTYREAMALRELKARRSEVRGEIFANSVSNFGSFAGRWPVRAFTLAGKYSIIVGAYALATYALIQVLYG